MDNFVAFDRTKDAPSSRTTECPTMQGKTRKKEGTLLAQKEEIQAGEGKKNQCFRTPRTKKKRLKVAEQSKALTLPP